MNFTRIPSYCILFLAVTLIAEQDFTTNNKEEIANTEVVITEEDNDRNNDDSSNTFTPNDPLFPQQWGLHNVDGFDINALSAWAQTRGDRKIAIAILDTGVDVNHPDIINNLWVNPHEIPGNGKDDDNNGYVDDIHGINAITGSGNPMDDNGHGTHVAGVIGAEGNNGIGIAGVMHEVSLIPCKFLDEKGSGTIKAALRCMDYIADLSTREVGVTIVATNNAWGGGPYDQDFLDAIEEHRDLGILFVTDAGGTSRNIDGHELYPAAYDVANVIVVAKADSNGRLTANSNFGANSVHIAAPGLTIWSTFLGGTYSVQSGSSATGFVSGVIGLLSAHDPSASWAQIKNRILASAVKMDSDEDSSKLIAEGFIDAQLSLAH